MLRKTSPATAQLVSLSAVKRQCRVESSEYDALINVYLSAAIDYVEREAAVVAAAGSGSGGCCGCAGRGGRLVGVAGVGGGARTLRGWVWPARW